MKRPSIAKRRDRRTGLSPYHRYKKAPYQYSEAYRAWKRAHRVGGGS